MSDFSNQPHGLDFEFDFRSQGVSFWRVRKVQPHLGWADLLNAFWPSDQVEHLFDRAGQLDPGFERFHKWQSSVVGWAPPTIGRVWWGIPTIRIHSSVISALNSAKIFYSPGTSLKIAPIGVV